jgi:murein tripeptide amidase MpaA
MLLATHAREWVTTSVATWIIKELSMESSKQGSSSYYSKGLLTHFDFYIMPLLNPDGYRHSWDYNRLWRKSRRPINNSLFGSLGTAIGCRGVDLNRNFGFEWGGEGSGSSSCSLVYKGETPFSEPETKAVRDFVNNYTGNIKWLAYFSLHSYGQVGVVFLFECGN